MKCGKKGAVFAIAIAVMLLMATTMVLSSTEPQAEMVKLMPSEPITFPSERVEAELIYDDGSAEGKSYWYDGGNGDALRFTPLSYPADLKTARVCLWPNCPDSDHEQFAIEVYDDNGPSGEPGTKLGGPVYYTATDFGWCDVDISGLGISIDSGDFYILFKQLADSPDCECLCFDKDPPVYDRSWYYFGGDWFKWPHQNTMIRCVVEYCPIEVAVCMAGVPDPDEILDPLRELRDGYLKAEYVDRYYDYSTELTMAMTKDPALAYEAARLLVKYSPMIQQQVTGTGKVKLITGRDVEEVVSFTDRLKRSVLKNRGEIGATRSHEIIKYMDEFKEQVGASEGKTFGEALQSSIYFEFYLY